MNNLSAVRITKIQTPQMVNAYDPSMLLLRQAHRRNPYALTVTKENCQTTQVLSCHKDCLKKALHEPKVLYLEVL